MPVGEDVPEPLKAALEDMEAKVQSFKSSISFAAPEMFDTFFAELQMGLASTMADLYTNLTGDNNG